MKGSMMPPLVAALIAVPAAAQTPSLEPVTGEWLVAAFKTYCAEPFGDRARLTEAVARAEPAFTPIEQDPARPMPGSSGWQSAKATLSYTDGNLLPRPLPSPQCALTVRPVPDYDHAAATAALAGALGLAPAKPKGKNGRFTSQWNFAGPKGEKRRLFLSQEPGPDGARVRVSLLNLR